MLADRNFLAYRDTSEPAHCGYRHHRTLRCARGAAPARSRHSVELRADAGTSVPAAAEDSARSRRGDRRRLRLRSHLQPGLDNVETGDATRRGFTSVSARARRKNKRDSQIGDRFPCAGEGHRSDKGPGTRARQPKAGTQGRH